MYKKACRIGKEPVNLLILGSLSTGGLFGLPQGCQPKLKKSTDLSIKILGFIFGGKTLKILERYL
jgi:hypothetical protein